MLIIIGLKILSETSEKFGLPGDFKKKGLKVKNEATKKLERKKVLKTRTFLVH